VFASTQMNLAGGVGLVLGTGTFFGKQVASAGGCSIYAFALTYVMLKVIDVIAQVRIGDEAERGSDEFTLGENACADSPLGVSPALETILVTC
jgi:ammonia channel protein AmtB